MSGNQNHLMHLTCSLATLAKSKHFSGVLEVCVKDWVQAQETNCTGLLLLVECTFVWNKNRFFGIPKVHKKIF